MPPNGTLQWAPGQWGKLPELLCLLSATPQQPQPYYPRLCNQHQQDPGSLLWSLSQLAKMQALSWPPPVLYGSQQTHWDWLGQLFQKRKLTLIPARDLSYLICGTHWREQPHTGQKGVKMIPAPLPPHTVNTNLSELISTENDSSQNVMDFSEPYFQFSAGKCWRGRTK